MKNSQIIALNVISSQTSDTRVAMFLGILYGLDMAARHPKEASEYFVEVKKGMANEEPLEIVEHKMQAIVDGLLGID